MIVDDGVEDQLEICHRSPVQQLDLEVLVYTVINDHLQLDDGLELFERHDLLSQFKLLTSKLQTITFKHPHSPQVTTPNNTTTCAGGPDLFYGASIEVQGNSGMAPLSHVQTRS